MPLGACAEVSMANAMKAEVRSKSLFMFVIISSSSHFGDVHSEQEDIIF